MNSFKSRLYCALTIKLYLHTMELKGSLTASHEVDSMDDGVVVLDLNSLTPTSGNRTELKLASDGHV